MMEFNAVIECERNMGRTLWGIWKWNSHKKNEAKIGELLLGFSYFPPLFCFDSRQSPDLYLTRPDEEKIRRSNFNLRVEEKLS